ncbi:hypothetical protein PIB30_043583 [Stylosanthes scabra]|uniref:Uncharacterized protein n=1 Tax=Stylosanthes scabra TaxID=79078 RepID=A0ABU6RFN9_9FABA|nr:hypothetical protein [Stylosanthes scabra]
MSHSNPISDPPILRIGLYPIRTSSDRIIFAQFGSDLRFLPRVCGSDPIHIHMDGTYEQPRASTPDVDFAPDNYTQWVADMIAQSSYQPAPEVIGQSSYQPPPDFLYWGTPVQHTEPFAHMSAETPPTAYAPRRQVPSESSSSGEHQIRTQVDRGLGRGHRETRRPPCGTGGCLDPVVGRRGRERGPQ